MSDNGANERSYADWLVQAHAFLAEHRREFPRLDDCPDPECFICGFEQCPLQEPLHFHHDGCPACSQVSP